MRELDRAYESKLPLILVHESDPSKGGDTLEKMRAECPSQYRTIFEPKPLFRSERGSMGDIVEPSTTTSVKSPPPNRDKNMDNIYWQAMPSSELCNAGVFLTLASTALSETSSSCPIAETMD